MNEIELIARNQLFPYWIIYALLFSIAIISILKLQKDFVLTQNKDTIFISEAVIQHKNNKIKGDLAFIISDPSTAKTHPLPIEILKTSISSDNFNIPVLLEPLEKNIFETAFFNGYMNYEKESGLQGDVSFKNITFNSIPSKKLQIKKVTLSAEKESAKLRSEERRVGKGVDLGGCRMMKKKKKEKKKREIRRE